MSELKPPSQNTVRAVFWLAVPVLAEQMLAVGVGLVDTWLTGNFLPGDQYLAAIGQIAYLLWLIPSLFAFVSIGATALVSRFTGSSDAKLANASTHQAFVLGGIMSALITVWLAYAGDWLIRRLALPADAAALAQMYLRYIVPVIPAIIQTRTGFGVWPAPGRGSAAPAAGLLRRVS